MTLKLVVAPNVDGGGIELVLDKDVIRVGRHRDNDLRIEETYVSGYHSELRRTEDGHYEVVDCGSSNGTYLNGRPVETPERIRAGDFLGFGILRADVMERGAESHTATSDVDEIPPVVPLRNRPAEGREREVLASQLPPGHPTGRVESVRADAVANGEPPGSPTGGREGDAPPRDLEEACREIQRLSARRDELSRQSGEFQAELARLGSEKAQTEEDLESSRTKLAEFRAENEGLKRACSHRDREIEERDREQTRSDSEVVLELKRELSEALAAKSSAEERADRTGHEKQSLAGSYQRLEDQLKASEVARSESIEREKELGRERDRLAALVEEAEAKNGELATRLEGEAGAALAGQALIEKLETRLCDDEAEAQGREQARIAEMETRTAELRQEIEAGERALRQKEQEAERLRDELARAGEARDASESRNREWHERVLQLESEERTLKELLRQSEAEKSKLSAYLEEQSARADDHLRGIAELQRELEETIEKAGATEEQLLENHRVASETLLDELHLERERRQSLAKELEDTRHGFSAALRYERGNAERERGTLTANQNTRLAAVEDELSRAIRAREELERTRDELQDQLGASEERIEELIERVEDLELQLGDERQERQELLATLATTREGFSRALDARHDRLNEVVLEHDESERDRQEAEARAARAAEEIERLRARLDSEREKWEARIREGEQRYEQLHEEKEALAKEDATFRQLRDQIEESSARKNELEAELEALIEEVERTRTQREELEQARDELTRERDALETNLEADRAELEAVRKKCARERAEEETLGESLRSAEQRIEALEHLETEMDEALERKRRRERVDRSEIFHQRRHSSPGSNGRVPDEGFCRELVAQLDVLDELTAQYRGKWRYPGVSGQLARLEEGFLDFLREHSIDRFDPEPGTEVSLEERRRIKLLPPREGSGNGNDGHPPSRNGHDPRVLETVRPGYVYRGGDGDIVIRKAEVVVE